MKKTGLLTHLSHLSCAGFSAGNRYLMYLYFRQYLTTAIRELNQLREILFVIVCGQTGFERNTPTMAVHRKTSAYDQEME